MKSKIRTLLLTLPLLILIACDSTSEPDEIRGVFMNEKLESPQKTMLIALNTPSVDSPYYGEVFEEIIDFQSAYAQAIIDNGDEVKVLANKKTLPLIEDRFPEGVLMEANVADIWMRDFSPINPYNPIMFRYAAAAQAGSQSEADYVQDTLWDAAEELGLSFPTTDYILDGGNVVDNYAGRAVVTDRFLEDNNLSKQESKEELKKLLNATQVAIIPNDDPEGLGHADGMLMFVEGDVIILNKYDEPFRTQVIDELESEFEGVKIIEVDVNWDGSVWDENFPSACGINVNASVTEKNIYLPHFGQALDDEVMKIVQENTSKKVVPIPAEGVCSMGGSVRCLSWQRAI